MAVMVMIWSWFNDGWSPCHLLRRTAVFHNPLIKPAPILLMALFAQGNVFAGMWEHVSGSEVVVCLPLQ